MSESGDYEPGEWRGHDFSTARRTYEEHVGRSYTAARDTSSTRGSNTGSRKKDSRVPSDLLVARIATKCPRPLVIVSDVTGSMRTWPTTMFSKLPYLELEGQEYLGKTLEICFCAFGDAHADDTYFLQVRPFTSGTDLKTRMLEIQTEGGGGNGLSETSELAALYLLHNFDMDKVARPIIIFITDEMPYEDIDAETAARVGVKLKRRTTATDVFKQLRQRSSVYLVRKPYGDTSLNSMDSNNQAILECWRNHLGSDHVSDLADPTRVVDVIFGILAKETDRIDYFREEITERQEDAQVKTVYRSLASIHVEDDDSSKRRKARGASITKGGSSGRRSKPLL